MLGPGTFCLQKMKDKLHCKSQPLCQTCSLKQRNLFQNHKVIQITKKKKKKMQLHKCYHDAGFSLSTVTKRNSKNVVSRLSFSNAHV